MIRLLAIVLVVASVLAAPARAEETMSFYVSNQQDFDVALELYGERPGRVWPGGGQVYLIERGMKKSIPIQCEGGERICWGAWRNGDDRISFGAGPDKVLDCERCCYLCSTTSTERIVLGE